MSSINFYETLKKSKSTINPHFDEHGIEIPFRMLIAAPSGSGKTNSLCRLIYAMGKTFHEIIVCVLSADEPLYRMMEQRLVDEHGRPQVRFFEEGSVPDISEYSRIDPKTKKLKRIDKLQRLIVFDDLVLNRAANNKAKEYYIKGRKLGFSMCYLSQSYYATPKMIRDNCQIFILGKNLLKKDLRMILNVFPTNLTLEEFERLYNDMTKNPLDTITIDITKRYLRRNIVSEPIEI